MAEKFSDFTPVSNLEPGYEFALLLPGDNGRVTVDVLNDHIEDQVETLIGGFFVNGIGTTFNTNKYDLGGNFGANSIDLVGDNSSVHIGNDNIIFAFDNSSYTFQEAFADLKATDGADESGLGLTSLESHLYSRYDNAELYIGVNDENVLLSYINTGVNTSITLTNDIVIDADSDIIFPGFANSVLTADALGVLSPSAIRYEDGKFMFSAGENIDIIDSSWSAFFGENHTINGIFNDGIIAGEDHFSEGDAGNNAIFGRNNSLTGTGTKNFNLLSGDGNSIEATGINSSIGNFVVGVGNTLSDVSYSAAIGENLNVVNDRTLYVNNIDVESALTLQNFVDTPVLAVDNSGSLIDGSGLHIGISTTTYSIDASDKGYLLIFTNVSGCSVTIPDNLPEGFSFATMRAFGAGVVSHVAGGTATLYTESGSYDLESENTASSWISTEPGIFYGFGAFGSGEGLQNVITTNPILDAISIINIETEFQTTSDPTFAIEYDDGTIKHGFYMYELPGAYYYPALTSGDFAGGGASRYVFVNDAQVNMGVVDGLGAGAGLGIEVDQVHIESSTNNVDAYFGGTSPNGINGIDIYANEIGIAAPQMVIGNDLNSTTFGLLFDDSTEELDILAGNVIIQALGSGTGVLNIQSGQTDFTGIVAGNSDLISTQFSGVVFRNASTVGNVGAGDDVLKSYSLPAGSLSVDLKTITLSAAGTFANTVNSKRIRLKFGSDTIFDSGALGITTAADWVLTSEIVRTGAATQRCITRLATSSSVLVATCDYATASQTLSGAVTISLTGEATADNDVTCEMIIIRHEP